MISGVKFEHCRFRSGVETGMMPQPRLSLHTAHARGRRRTRAGIAVMLGVWLAANLVGCSSWLSAGGGAPTVGSMHLAVYTAMAGLSEGNEKTFLSAVQSGRSEAKIAWTRCEPAVRKGAIPTFPGYSDPRSVSIIVAVPHDAEASCLIGLSWTSSKHWSMLSANGHAGLN
jgi:hypothetical protein